MKSEINKSWLKLVIGFFACFLIRIIPWRAPNIEPIMAAQLPFAKAYGAYTGFLFGFMSIIFYDLVTGTLGAWSVFTASAYGLVGLWAAYLLKNREPDSLTFASVAVFGTLFFDAITGLTIGPLFFHQPFLEALIGQIPFTALHLMGNVMFSLLLSPLIYKYVIENKKLEVKLLVLN